MHGVGWGAETCPQALVLEAAPLPWDKDSRGSGAGARSAQTGMAGQSKARAGEQPDLGSGPCPGCVTSSKLPNLSVPCVSITVEAEWR